MREIKFRAWDKYKKEFETTLVIRINGTGYLEERFILSQYTGLKDKNGKEIYEGDILKENKHGNTVKHKVEYDIDYCGYEPFQSMCYCESCGSDYLSPEDCEIVGNIYENPELLEAKS